MDGLTTHGERPLQAHTQLQEKLISRRVVEFSMGIVIGDHHPQVIQDLSQHRPARFHPLFCGRRALSSGKEAVCLPSRSEARAPGTGNEFTTLVSGLRRAHEGRFRSAHGRCVHGGSMQSDDVAERCKLHPASAVFTKPSSRRLPGSPARIESSGSAGAPLIHHDTVRGLSTDAINSFPPLRQGS